MANAISSEAINKFLNGHDPMERIISIECNYVEDKVSIIYVNEEGDKRVKKDDFKPFAWAKNSACVRMFNGDRKELVKRMRERGIGVKGLITKKEGFQGHERLENGYKYLFYATRRMTYKDFLNFFEEAGTPIYPKTSTDSSGRSKEFIVTSPVEQYMISTGKRLFKGYENYDELKRMMFDLETQGLNPRIHAIEQIGIRTNKGYEKIITITGNGTKRAENELNAIIEFIRIIAEEKPDIIAGHNSENFDWDFIVTRCEVLGTSLAEISQLYFHHPIYKKKKETVLKLGGEMEYYHPTIAWGFNILDSLHAVRRAQAIDSNMKKATLKYTTQYLGLKKENRVYVPGNIISQTWNVTEEKYAFREKDGDWYEIKEGRTVLEDKGYKPVSGRYIVERYLLDDIWETDKVELALNEANFLVSKILPTSFTRACTMGTAGIWKLIMLAWSYENDLAIPAHIPNKKFTGGLSRLLKTGYVSNVVKLDFNSLYPATILTWNIPNEVDIDSILNKLLEYILTNREKYKNLKGEAGSKAKALKDKLSSFEGSEEEKEKIKKEIAYWNAEKSANDKKQLPLKILANSYFGSNGSPSVFPHGSLYSAEMTTCIGRMELRLMISHFTNIGYMPIVGDTDGFNFQKPSVYRYTEEKPYISNGGGRNSIKGKAYVELKADVAEFEDLYFNQAWNEGVNKSGLGIDEECDACIQFARKNYSDLMPDGSTKKVGNTIKSRKMSGYLEKFIDNGINLLLHGEGSKFIDAYYDYVSRIYNYQIPLKDIASKGKIKKSLKDYVSDCNTLTKSGSKKSRQAWYELVLKNGINAQVSDTIYYINTGTKKGHSDVKRVTHQYVKDNEGNEVELLGKIKTNLFKTEIEKGYVNDNGVTITAVKDLKAGDKKKILAKHIIREEDEIILNCQLVPNEIINDDNDILCSDVEGLEYNSEKYIDQFNNRVRPLLVCFSPEIRHDILITNPDDRKYFTNEQAALVSGYPNKPEDQDTYEALMTPERKEIAFWTSIDKRPPFVEECGIDWDKLVNEYHEIKKKEDDALFQEENAKYMDALENLTKDEIETFYEDGTIPPSLLDIVTVDSDMHFYFKKIPTMTPSTGGFIFDDISMDNDVIIEKVADDE